MKYLYILFFALALTGCHKTSYVEFNGNMPGIDNGEFVIKDVTGKTIFNESINGGKFQFKKFLAIPGYYTMVIIEDITKDYKQVGYDVYLEDGKYDVGAQGGKLYKYPVIKTESKTQNELSDYYTVASEKTNMAKKDVDTLYDQLYSKDAPAVQSDKYNTLLADLNKAIATRDNILAATLDEYATKYPQSSASAHILSLVDYKKNPEAFWKVYQKFSDAAKNSEDGKDEGMDLKDLVKLAPGAAAPALSAKTADGKAFDPKSINKKVILVEFWRADNKVSRLNHNLLLTDSYSPLKNKDFTVVSVSLDTVKAIWTSAIAEDKMTWTQLSDIDGLKSADMKSWEVNSIPTYNLLDDKWHLIKRDIEFKDIALAVKDHLKQ